MVKLAPYVTDVRIDLSKILSIPSSWEIEAAHFLFNEVRDGTHDSPKAVDEGVPLVTSKNLKSGTIDLSNTKIISVDDYEEISKRSAVQEGDILFSMIGTIGHVAVVPKECKFSVKNVGLFRKNARALNEKFSYYWLCSDTYQKYLERKQRGGNQKFVSLGVLRESPIPLPPLAEQTVIAQTLDTLLAQVENIKTRLDAIPKILKTFRQSVLAAAVSGKLTEAWRGENQCEPVDQLISECASKILDKKSLKFSDKSFRDDEIKHSLPETWAWVRLAKISEVVSGVAKGSKTKEETVQLPYLRVANVQRGYLDLKEVKEISVPRSKAEKLALAKGDILFNEGGDIDKLGRGWIWEDQVENCIHQNHVFRARCYSDLIQPKYISHYGNTEGKEYFLREGTQSVNLANINKTTLSLLPIPLPPSEEQTEIVRRVEELFTFADQIEQQVKNAQGRVNNLTQSILAKAFRGELTGQWRAENQDLITGDNSAEALLAKIQEERDALKKSSKPKTKSTAKKTTRKKAAKKPA